MYRCLNCRKDVELDAKSKRVRCPFCGYRIMLRTKSVTPRRVISR